MDPAVFNPALERKLYLDEYMDHDCKIHFNVHMTKDDLAFSFYTAWFLSGTVFVLAFITTMFKFFHFRCKPNSLLKIKQSRSRFLSVFFWLTAVGYGIVGGGHYVIDNKTEDKFFIFVFGWGSTFFIYVGNFFLDLSEGVGGRLIRYMMNHDGGDDQRPHDGRPLHRRHITCWTRFDWQKWSQLFLLSFWAIVQVLVLTVFLLMPEKQMKLLGGLIIATYASITLIYSWQLAVAIRVKRQPPRKLYHKHHSSSPRLTTSGGQIFLLVAKCVSMLFITFSCVLNHVLYPICGDPNYEFCFEGCPLPAKVFNHNALFYCMLAIGFTFYAFTMLVSLCTCPNDEDAGVWSVPVEEVTTKKLKDLKKAKDVEGDNVEDLDGPVLIMEMDIDVDVDDEDAGNDDADEESRISIPQDGHKRPDPPQMHHDVEESIVDDATA